MFIAWLILAGQGDLGTVLPAQQDHATRRRHRRFAVLGRRRHRRFGLNRFHALAHGLLRLVGPHCLEFCPQRVELLLLRLDQCRQAIDVGTLLRCRIRADSRQRKGEEDAHGPARPPCHGFDTCRIKPHYSLSRFHAETLSSEVDGVPDQRAGHAVTAAAAAAQLGADDGDDLHPGLAQLVLVQVLRS
jgi:hypothetical protein